MNYISIKQILDDLLDDPQMNGLTLERAVNWTVEFIKLIGMPLLFEDKTDTVTISDYTGTLPTDFYEMIQVREEDTLAYFYSTDSFGVSMPSTYKIKGNNIYISKEEATLEIAYRAFKTDDDGYPLIIDNGSTARALELYIQKRWFTKLFNNQKLPLAILQNTQQEYAFAVKQASNDLVRPSIDQLESITHILNSLLPRTREHANGFKQTSMPEILKF